MQQREKWSWVQQKLDLAAQPITRKFYFRTCMYILLTETHKLRLRYEIETGTKERFSLRKNPETVRKRLRAAAGRENRDTRVAAQQCGR